MRQVFDMTGPLLFSSLQAPVTLTYGRLPHSSYLSPAAPGRKGYFGAFHHGSQVDA